MTARRVWIIFFVFWTLGCLVAAHYSPWGPDQTIAFRKAIEFVVEGHFPKTGILNSMGQLNPNGLVWVLSPFVVFTRDPYWVSVFLGLLQGGLVVFCYIRLQRVLGRVSGLWSLAVLPIFLFTPAMFFTVTDPFGQFVARTLLLLNVTAWVQIYLGSATLPWHFWAGFGFLFLPAVHLSVFTTLPVFGVAALWLFFQKRLKLVPFMLGAVLPCFLCWIPWLQATALESHWESYQSTFPSSWWFRIGYAFVPFALIIQNMGNAMEGYCAVLGNPILSKTTLLVVAGAHALRWIVSLLLGTQVVLHLKRYSSRTLLFLLFLCLGPLSLLGFSGMAWRQDYVLIHEQAILLVLTVVGLGYFHPTKWVQGLLAGVWILTLFAFVLILIENSRSTEKIKWTDGLLRDRVAILDRLIPEIQSQITLGVELSPSLQVGRYVKSFANRPGSGGYYRPSLFFETYLSYTKALGPRVLFVNDAPQFIISVGENPRAAQYELLATEKNFQLWKRKK